MTQITQTGQTFDLYQSMLKDYLESDSNYALLIHGKWGIGKTFHYKNKLKSFIENINVRGDASKKYKPIRISLYGIKSIDELYNEIWLELHPFFRNKKVVIGLGLIKTLIKAGLQIKYGIRNLDKQIDDVSKTISTQSRFEQILLCFDDVERRGPDFKIKEIIGFINNLVENNNIKIIIIANYDKIEHEDKTELFEKTIGKNIKYLPNIESDLLSIITSRYENAGSKIIAGFLKANLDVIIDVMSHGNTGNYRSVIYGLSYFEKYFYELHLKFDKKLNENEWLEKLRSLLGIILAFSIEYRETVMEDTQIVGVRNAGFGALYFSGFNYDAETKTELPLEEPYENKFYKNYKSKAWHYYSYTNAIDYIAGRDRISIESLLTEFNISFKSDETLPEQYKILKNIQYGNYYQWNDEEFKILVNKVIEYMINGKYNFHMIPDIFSKLCFFRDAISIDLNYIYESCIKGANAYVENYSTENEEPHIEGYIYNDPQKDILNLYNTLKDELKEIESKIDHKGSENLANNYMLMFHDNIGLFIESLQLKNGPIFLHLLPDEVFERIVNLSNTNLWNLAIALNIRFARFYPYRKQESIFLEKLSEVINAEIEKTEISMRRHLLINILKSVGGHIKELNEVNNDK